MYLENSKGNSDGPPNKSPVQRNFFLFFFPLLAKIDVKRSLDFLFSYSFSLSQFRQDFFRERENIKNTNVKILNFFSSDVFFNLIFNPFFILKYTLLLLDRLTVAKQMVTAERLSNAVGGKVKFLRMLKQCTVRIFKLKPVYVSVRP